TIGSVLTGKALLSFLSGLFCFLAVARFASPLLGLTTAVFFWAYFPDFFYSYNHTGGITCFLAIIYLLFSYFKDPRRSYVYAGFGSLLLLCLIRVNMGIALLFGFVAVLFMTDKLFDREHSRKNIKLYIWGSVFVLGVSGLIYWLMLHSLPGYAIKQCMPYFNKTYHAESDPDPFFKYGMYFSYIRDLVASNPRFLFILILLLICSARSVMFFLQTPVDLTRKNPLHFSLGVTLFLLALVSHEFFMGAHLYRVNWTSPYQMLFFALAIHFGTRNMKPSLQHVLVSCVLLVALLDLFNYYGRINQNFKIPEQYLHAPKAKIYVGNRQAWIRTVENISLYLNEHLAPEETFFALPYEPLYYYLTNRKSPSWHVLLMKGSNINAVQEREMMDAVKDPRVKYVVLSNRYRYT
ncbi:MAG: hypothetical protein K8I82_14425, partial [Anaerolineae bacterium]|nr:hypothetical protein [Anaerolineae bacterium]